jgi:CDP-diacylglycerol---serine O-phosphatidyltransferase
MTPYDFKDPDVRRRRFRPIPVRMLVPNVITLLAICAGLTSIRLSIEGRMSLAVYAIVFAAALDGIDGRIARMIKGQSKFGAELDSLADFVNFGVAPAIIMFNWALDDLHSFGWIAVLVFAVCSALRLARFNVSLDRTDLPAWKANYFVGVPAPAGAIVLLLPIYAQDLGLHVPILTPLVLFYTLGIALLMVSNVPTFSGKLIGQKIAREYVPPVFVLAALFMALLLTYPSATLAIGSLTYLAMIPVSVYRYLAEERKAAKTAKAQNGKGHAPGKHDEKPAQPVTDTSLNAKP